MLGKSDTRGDDDGGTLFYLPPLLFISETSSVVLERRGVRLFSPGIYRFMVVVRYARCCGPNALPVWLEQSWRRATDSLWYSRKHSKNLVYSYILRRQSQNPWQQLLVMSYHYTS